MPDSSFDDQFEIVPASRLDIDEITDIFCTSLLMDRLSIALNSQLTYEEHFANVRDDVQAPKFENPLYIWFKAVEKQSNKMVGWICMRLAGQDPVLESSHQGNAELPARMNKKVFQYMINDVGPPMLRNGGYDKDIHLSRSGLHVHPDFQRKGIATRLSKTLNDIADKEGKVTFVRARPAATSFFEWEGWTKIAEKPIPYRDFGVDLEADSMSVLRREPKGK